MTRPRPNDNEPWTEPEGGETAEALLATGNRRKTDGPQAAWYVERYADGTYAEGGSDGELFAARVLPWEIAKDPSIAQPVDRRGRVRGAGRKAR